MKQVYILFHKNIFHKIVFTRKILIETSFTKYIENVRNMYKRYITCEQKYESLRPSLLHVGHLKEAGLPQPGVWHTFETSPIFNPRNPSDMAEELFDSAAAIC